MMKQLLKDSDYQSSVLSDLNQMLDAEMAKPAEERDYQKIEEITRAFAVAIGDEEHEQAVIEEGIHNLEKSIHTRPRGIVRRIRYIVIAGVAIVTLLAANIYTVAAYQQNIFSVIVHYTKKSFSVEYPETSKAELPTAPDDPYGIKAECAKYGLDNVLAPTYIPEGFVLGNCDHHSADGYCTSVDFWFYRERDEVFQITYNLYADPSYYSSIPSDHFNLREINVQGIPAIVSEEDGQYTMIMKNEGLETIITSDCGYTECDQIVASLE